MPEYSDEDYQKQVELLVKNANHWRTASEWAGARYAESEAENKVLRRLIDDLQAANGRLVRLTEKNK